MIPLINRCGNKVLPEKIPLYAQLQLVACSWNPLNQNLLQKHPKLIANQQEIDYKQQGPYNKNEETITVCVNTQLGRVMGLLLTSLVNDHQRVEHLKKYNEKMICKGKEI